MKVVWDAALPYSDGRFHMHGLSAIKQTSLSANYEFSEMEEIAIFPNPANEFVVIASKFSTNFRVQFINQLGINCLETESESSIIKIDVSGLGSGIYLVNMIREDKTWIKKLVIE